MVSRFSSSVYIEFMWISIRFSFFILLYCDCNTCWRYSNRPIISLFLLNILLYNCSLKCWRRKYPCNKIVFLRNNSYFARVLFIRQNVIILVAALFLPSFPLYLVSGSNARIYSPPYTKHSISYPSFIFYLRHKYASFLPSKRANLIPYFVINF